MYSALERLKAEKNELGIKNFLKSGQVMGEAHSDKKYMGRKRLICDRVGNIINEVDQFIVSHYSLQYLTAIQYW